VVPAPGTRDHDVITNQRRQRGRSEYPDLSLEFRLRRSLLLIPVDHSTIEQQVASFDDLVADIEGAKGREMRTGDITQSWPADDSDQSMCTACDFRVTCPKDPSTAPSLPD
jgi:hypothetical protein